MHVYIDGSSRPHPRRGGIGIRFVYVDSEVEKFEDFPYPGFRMASNNQMELTACTTAFEEILRYPNVERFRKITIFSDSTYVIDNQNSAMFTWPKSKYRKIKDGLVDGLVENADLWKKWLKGRIKLSKRLREARLKLERKARRSNEHMKAVDNLAKAASRTCIGAPFRAIGVRRHRIPVEPGPVDFFGQKATIYVVTTEKMRVQNVNRYSCQVISRRSQYYKKKGVICSRDQLREGHRYTITCTEKQEDPGICDIQIHRKYKTKKETEQAALDLKNKQETKI